MQAFKEADVFAQTVAKVRQQELKPEFVEVPQAMQNPRSLGLTAKAAIVAGAAAFLALAYVLIFPSSQGTAEDSAMSASPWQTLKSSLFPAPQRKPAPTLVVQNGSGPVDEPLLLGVSVNAPSPGATVTIGRMPTGARLTAGKRLSPDEWRVPALDISEVSVIPPDGFAGEMNLSAELRSFDGAALVSSIVRLNWIVTAPQGNAAVDAVPPAAVPPSVPVATGPQQQEALAAPASPTDAASLPQPVTEPVLQLLPSEIAGMIRRAQEQLATGDLQAARLLLIRAATAHDARAALLLARTFDPNASSQFGPGDPGPDPVQARNWYQKAREWGSPEAQRQLDALASYPR